MAFFASVNGLQIVSGSLMIPLVGTWTADLTLAGQQNVSGKASVVIGNLTLAGYIYRSDVYGGQVRARMVGGAGGWRQPTTPQGYGNSAGIQLSTVLDDVAQQIGEQINIAADMSIGNAFARVAFATSVASDVLWQFVSQGIVKAWYVDPSGVTQTSAWPTAAVNTPYTVTDQKTDEGIVVVATEDYASWLPGCSFANPLLAGTYQSAGVHYIWDNGGKFRFEVLTGGAQDRMLGPLQQVIQKELAPSRFFGRYEYTISNPSGTTIDGSPVDTGLGLPELQSVPLLGSSIASYTPPDGGKAHVMFVDGKATAPVCVWTEADTESGPTAVTLAPQGSGANNVARVSDTVVVLFPPLVQVAGTVNGLPFIGVATFTSPAIGAIQTGSSAVQATS